jgi:ABC-type multidrug transport system fused ATPase/permease subunit
LSFFSSSTTREREKNKQAVRIVLNDPVVLLLDEPTASAVAESKDIIRALLREVIRERTALCISHDKDIDDLFDRVVVLDNGRIRG